MTAELSTYAPDGREVWNVEINGRRYRARLAASALVDLEVLRKPGPRRYGVYGAQVGTDGPTARAVLEEIRRARRLNARKLMKGDFVRVMVPGCGDVDFSDLGDEAPEDWERHFTAGTLARVSDIETFDNIQGYAVTLVILEGPARWVVNVFDESDKGMDSFPLVRVEGADKERAERLARKSERDLRQGPFGYEPCQLENSVSEPHEALRPVS